MRICDLRLLPDNTGSYFTIGPDRTLVLTVTAADVLVCPHCPNRHVRVMTDATPVQVRELAHKLTELAKVLETRS